MKTLTVLLFTLIFSLYSSEGQAATVVHCLIYVQGELPDSATGASKPFYVVANNLNYGKLTNGPAVAEKSVVVASRSDARFSERLRFSAGLLEYFGVQSVDPLARTFRLCKRVVPEKNGKVKSVKVELVDEGLREVSLVDSLLV